jgi:hypothetical protein
MRLLAERRLVWVWRVTRIVPLLVWIRPFRRVGLAHRVVQSMMWLGVVRAISGILPGGLREACGRLALRRPRRFFVVVRMHGYGLP